MIKNKIVYVALTEYQFLQSVNIATGIFKSEDDLNIIYVIKGVRRLAELAFKESLFFRNLKIFIIENLKPAKLAELVKLDRPNHFFFFQAGNFLNVYLGDFLSKKGVEISLGPDGYTSYVVYKKKHEFLSMIKDTLSHNFRMLLNGLFSAKIHKFDFYKYGSNRFIDNVWVTHPEQYKHTAKNRVNVLKLPEINSICLDIVKESFGFATTFPVKDVIYYFNQPLWTPKLIEKEFDFLRNTRACFVEKKLLIKLHPLTSESTVRLYQELEGVEIISSTAPAEIILLSLENCIVFTGWSSILMTENKRCNYYFNYPIYSNCDAKIIDQSNFIILNHIKLITSPKEMHFPNGES